MGINQLKRNASQVRRSLLVIICMAFFGIANAQTQWYGYVVASVGGQPYDDHFISFTAEDLSDVQAVSETLPEDLYAATYLDGYVWAVTGVSRSLCKAPFDEDTHTIGTFETVVPQVEPYNIIKHMAYNPVDGMMYYLCQDSQYNSILKRSDLANPSEVEVVGSLSQRLWTLAINSQGEAYGVAYEGGDLYQVDLSDASTTLVGPTGIENVWYWQSMAFDMNTDELYWARFTSETDQGFYQVNTQTGAATRLGTIGASGAQVTGLFMVWEAPTPEPEMITEIYVEGYTEPVWGEHPDTDVEIDPTAGYTINRVYWMWEQDMYTYGEMSETDVFDRDDVVYYMGISFDAKPGFYFSENLTVYYNGDPSIFDSENSHCYTNTSYVAWTINYELTDPAFGVDEQAVTDWESLVGETVRVYDMMGRLVRQERFSGQLNKEGLVPGVYFLHVAGRTIKFVKE